MKMRYFTPTITICEVTAERGYQASVEGPGFNIPGFGTDTDELV